MDPLIALITAVGIVLVASTATVLAIYQPLRRQLTAVCPVQSTAEFWMRAAVAVFYLVPLFVVLVFGLPDGSTSLIDPAQLVRRTLAAAAFALASIVITVALRLASTRPASKFDYPVR